MKRTRYALPRVPRPSLGLALGLTLGFGLGLAPAAGAQESGWLLTLDPAASEIRFTLGATMHAVHGTVALERGEIRIGPGSDQLSGEIVADARSADTGNERRDSKMHSKVLESERFPSFVLHLRRLEGELELVGTSRIELHGDLSLHGGTHAVVVPVEVQIQDDRLTASGRIEVPYVAWGMTDPSKAFLRVKKLVEVEVDVTGTLRSAEP